MRQRKKKLERKGHCRVYWGSHGCKKQRGHMGGHRCYPGCPHPEKVSTSLPNGWELYGEDS